MADDSFTGHAHTHTHKHTDAHTNTITNTCTTAQYAMHTQRQQCSNARMSVHDKTNFTHAGDGVTKKARMRTK